MGSGFSVDIGTYATPTKITTKSPFYKASATKLATTFSTLVVGLDATVSPSVLYIKDTTNASLKQSEDWVAKLNAGLQPTISNNKTLPANVASTNVFKIVRFGNYLWMLALDTVTGLSGMYRTLPVAGNGAFSWSAQLFTLPTGATGLGPDLNCDASYMYVGTYGDPVGGPTITRISLADANGAGTNWTNSFPADPTIRHCHSVTPDPYNPGNVWACFGDGTNKTIELSTDYGATWTVVVVSSAWQGVQVSFSPKWVWVAGDSMRGTVFVIDRATNIPYMASDNYHGDLPVHGVGGRTITDLGITAGSSTITSPSITSADRGKYLTGPVGLPTGCYLTSATTINANANATASAQTADVSADVPYANCYYGHVDPATDMWYGVSNDNSNAGTWQSMFWLPQVGGEIAVLLRGGRSVNLNAEVYVDSGYVISGGWARPTLAKA